MLGYIKFARKNSSLESDFFLCLTRTPLQSPAVPQRTRSVAVVSPWIRIEALRDLRLQLARRRRQQRALARRRTRGRPTESDDDDEVPGALGPRIESRAAAGGGGQFSLVKGKGVRVASPPAHFACENSVLTIKRDCAWFPPVPPHRWVPGMVVVLTLAPFLPSHLSDQEDGGGGARRGL